MNIKKSTNKGFTLIELLVVVAIIGLLSSIVFASLNSARSKARDAKRISEFNQISKALAFYFDKYGRYPNETAVGGGNWYANFDSMALQLKNEGFLSAIPVAPANPNPGTLLYSYYVYPGTTTGALLITDLENLAPTMIPKSPSCRPFGPPAGNWCSNMDLSQNYCICNSY